MTGGEAVEGGASDIPDAAECEFASIDVDANGGSRCATRTSQIGIDGMK
jgi:hypothetical protein